MRAGLTIEAQWYEWMSTRERCACVKSHYIACLSCGDVFDESIQPAMCMGAVACPACGVMTAQKADVTGETPPPDDKFIKEELAIAALLLLAFNQAVIDYEVIERVVDAAKSGNMVDVVSESDFVANDLAKAFDDAEIANDVSAQLDETFKRGLEVAGALSALSLLLHSRDRFNGQIEASIRYYTNNYFRRIVAPSLLDELNRHVTSLDGSTDLASVTRTFLERGLLDSDPYWRIVANQDVSRSHHYGMLRGMEERGYVIYQFVAVLDSRTTALCRSLDGTQFRVADGINHLEAIASVDPEAVRQLAPWVTAAQVAGLTSAQLTSMGVLVPPLHANCRSTVVAVS